MQEENNSSGVLITLAAGCGLMIALAVVITLLVAILISQVFVPVETQVVVAEPTVEVVLMREGAPDGSAYTWELVSSGFDNPLFVTHAGDGTGQLYALEQVGLIWIINPDGTQSSEPFLDISTLISADVQRGTYSERGLLGVAFDPDYETNGEFYISYTDALGDSVLARYQANATRTRADMDSAEIILTQDQPHHDHNGGAIAFGPDGYLYMGFGDGGSIDDPDRNGQNGLTLLGKILRLDVRGQETYAIPADNPFVGRADFLPEIWSYGVRNPWRFSFDRATGDFYIGDVGQWLIEEINYQAADSAGGENYGWNYYEGLLERVTDAPEIDMTEPVVTYEHNEGCSVTGGYVYRGAAMPELNGVYFYGDYCNGVIWTLWRDTAGTWQHALFQETERQIASFGEDESGELYLVDYKGDILRLTSAS